MTYKKSKRKLKRLISIFIILSVALTSIAFVGGTDKAFEKVKHLDIFYSLFKEVNLYYVDDIEPGEFIKTGIDAMLESLDPYTVFVPESDIEDIRIMTTGQYGGIGALIRRVGDYVVIAQPYEDRPAHKAGLKAGDKILELNGNCLKNRPVSDVSELLKGAPNSTIELKIKRPYEDKILEFSVVRQDIKMDAVPYYGLVHDSIGYIALNNFTNTAGRDVESAFRDLKDEHNINSIIIDLRGNPGGLLVEAVKIVNLFVDKGQEIVSTKGRIKQWDNVYRALKEPLDKDIKIAVLVNPASASASEIVAGAIQDLDRGVVIGQQTFGKGLVQTTRELSYNSMLKVTTAKYYIPSGRCIQALDYSVRDEEGQAVRIPDSLLTEFSTIGGRKVYEGGGIIPDVTLDPRRYSKVARSLILQNHVFEFANLFASKNDSIDSPYDFELSDLEYDNFIAFLENREFHYETETEIKVRRLIEKAKEEKYFERAENELNAIKEKLSQDKSKDLLTFKDEISLIIGNEIIHRYYFQRGSVIFGLNKDEEVNKAIEILTSDAYNQILKETYSTN